MANQAATIDAQVAPFTLKGSLFTLTVLILQQTDMTCIDAYLAQLVTETPNFFKHMPIVIDVSQLDGELDFPQLKAILRDKRIIPVGIRGGHGSLNAAALSAGFALFPMTSDDTAPIAPKPAPQPEEQPAQVQIKETTVPSKTLVITQPVRSGQQIFAKQGDLIIMASVGHGAEVIATGNIHVYGPLRGRALAGVGGDESARIFCRELEAELLAIAGNYMVKENMDKGQYAEFFGPDKHLKQVFLDNSHLQIATL